MTFEQIIAQAKLASPGGFLAAPDMKGLIRRGQSMGHSADEARRIINETPAADRAPRFNQHWRDEA